MEKTDSRPGMLDLSNRVLKELLRTPKFKAQVKIFLGSLDPPAAAELARTLMWEDPELFLDLVGLFPDLLNAALSGAGEMAERMEQYPAPLLAAFLAQLMDKIDGEALGALIAALPALHGRVQDVPGAPLQQSLERLGRRVSRGMGAGEEGQAAAALAVLQPWLRRQIRGLAEEAKKEGSGTQALIRGLSQTLAEALQENPDFVTYVCMPLLEPFRRAAGNGAED